MLGLSLPAEQAFASASAIVSGHWLLAFSSWLCFSNFGNSGDFGNPS
jgi:hypothetical protein